MKIAFMGFEEILEGNPLIFFSVGPWKISEYKKNQRILLGLYFENIL